MTGFRPLSRRQSVLLAIGGPVGLAFFLGLLAHLLGIPAQAGAIPPASVPTGSTVSLPRPSALPASPAASPLTLESLATILAAAACEDWPRARVEPSAAIALRVAKSEGVYRYHHAKDAGLLEKVEPGAEKAKATWEGLGAALKLEADTRGASAFVLVSAAEAAGAKAARLDSAAAAGRAAERLRVAAEGLGLRTRIIDRFDPAAAVERFSAPATEVPMQIVVVGVAR